MRHNDKTSLYPDLNLRTFHHFFLWQSISSKEYEFKWSRAVLGLDKSLTVLGFERANFQFSTGTRTTDPSPVSERPDCWTRIFTNLQSWATKASCQQPMRSLNRTIPTMGPFFCSDRMPVWIHLASAFIQSDLSEPESFQLGMVWPPIARGGTFYSRPVAFDLHCINI